MKQKNLIYLFVFLLFWCSCTKQIDEVSEEEKVQVPLRVKIGMRSTPSPENDINRIRIMAFTAPGGTSKLNQLFDETSLPDLRFSFWTGTYDFWFIANEPEVIGSVTAATIGNVKLNYTPGTPVEIPMTSKLAIRTVTDVNTDLGMVEVVRTMVKIELKVVVNPEDFSDKPIPVITSALICGLPRYCFLVSKEYDSDEYINSETQTPEITTQSGKTIYTFVFYVPEFILADPSQYAWIKIEGKTGESGEDCLWGSTSDTGVGDGESVGQTGNPKNDLRRNTIYELTASVKGYGDHHLIINTRVADWTTIDIDDDLN